MFFNYGLNGSAHLRNQFKPIVIHDYTASSHSAAILSFQHTVGPVLRRGWILLDTPKSIQADIIK